MLSNPRIDLQEILRSHRVETLRRIGEHRIVLAVQDTTVLNYGVEREVEGLGPINNADDKSVGLILHDMVVFTEEGTPLGVVHADCWARDKQDVGKAERRAELLFEEKESYKWMRGFMAAAELKKHCPETQVIVVGDRESDIYEVFLEASTETQGPDVLIRAEKTRNRKVGGCYLWDNLERRPEQGVMEVEVPRKGDRPPRKAKLAVRFKQVTLSPPRDRRHLKPVQVYAVYVREIEYGADVKEPLEWMLLTSVRVEDFEQAVRVVSWYCIRSGIEVFHKVLKSGCRIEDRQLHSGERIQTAMGIDLVLAWRIFYLTKLGRETPNAPCTLVFEEDEWRAIIWYRTQQPPPEQPPTLSEVTRMVAKLGGFLGRKCDGEPGIITLWRGLRLLYYITCCYRIHIGKPRDAPSFGVKCG